MEHLEFIFSTAKEKNPGFFEEVGSGYAFFRTIYIRVRFNFTELDSAKNMPWGKTPGKGRYPRASAPDMHFSAVGSGEENIKVQKYHNIKLKK